MLKKVQLEDLSTFNIKNIKKYQDFLSLFPEKIQNIFLSKLDYSNNNILKKISNNNGVKVYHFKEYCEYIQKNEKFLINKNEADKIRINLSKNNNIILKEDNIDKVLQLLKKIDKISNNEKKSDLDYKKGNTLKSLQNLYPSIQWTNKSADNLKKEFFKIVKTEDKELNLSDINLLEKRDKILSFINPNFDKNNNIDFSSILLSRFDTSLRSLEKNYTPLNLERIQNFLIKKIGFSEASQFITRLAQKVSNKITPSYKNIKTIMTIVHNLKNEKTLKDSDNNDTYQLLGSFIANKVNSFLLQELGNNQEKKEQVDENLKKYKTSLYEIENLLQSEGVNFSIKKSNTSKALDQLKKGNFSYVLRKTFNSIKSKIVSRDTTINEKINVIQKKLDWKTKDGITVKSLEKNNETQGQLFTFDPQKINMEVVISPRGVGIIPENKIPFEMDPVFVSAFAFTADGNKIKGFTIKDGEILNTSLIKNKYDAITIFNKNKKITILNKENLTLKELYTAVGINIPKNISKKILNKKLNISENINDYFLMTNLLKKSKSSLLSSILLMKNGKPLESNSKKLARRRILIEKNNGEISIFNSSKDMTITDAIETINTLDDVKNAALMDTGSEDFAKSYEKDQSREIGTKSGGRLSNFILFSKKK